MAGKFLITILFCYVVPYSQVFFMKARYVEGDFEPNKDMAEDYVWVTRDELDKYVNQSYGHELKKFVMNLSLEPHIEDFELPTYEPAAVGSKN